jgi:hypothetical protein
MLAVKVDHSHPTNLHEQVAAEIRRAIADAAAESPSPPPQTEAPSPPRSGN